MSVTIKDVAVRVGVAPSTVSRVIHGNSKISEETQIKVRKAMEELGYQPNAAARSLARGKSRTLGLIIPNSAEDLFFRPFFIMAMRGLSIEAQKRGYNIMFSFSSSEEEEVAFIDRYIRMNITDGIILMTSRKNDKCMTYLEEKGYPYVLIGRPESQFKNALWVDNDNFHAMYGLVAFFLGQGKKRIAFLGGPEDFSVTRERLRGYREAMRTHGLEEQDELIFLAGGFGEKDGHALGKKILSDESIEAVAAADDLLAMGLMASMGEEGRYLPIAGFNNSTKGSVITPTLTSIDIQPEVLGCRAASLLIDRLEKEELSMGHYIVDTLLVERESTDSDFLNRISES